MPYCIFGNNFFKYLVLTVLEMHGKALNVYLK